MNKDIKKTLYTIDSSSRVRIWEVWVESEPEWGISYTDSIQGGKVKTPAFKKSEIKNVGKSNETSLKDQALIDYNNAVGKKLRSNYFNSISEAVKNKLWLPMLAHKFEDYNSKIPFPRASQVKIDGSRCNIYWSELENKVVAKTRTGKDYFSIPHLIKELSPICEKYKDLIFDGELYNHSYKNDFEKIMSLARKSKPTVEDLKESEKLLEFHVYDMYSSLATNASFAERSNYLEIYFKNNSLNMVKLVKTDICNNSLEEDLLQEKYLNEGYEGQMIRNLNSPYKVDGRSRDLLKRKVFSDEEFEIIDVIEGDANWKGCAKNIIIKLPDGRTQGCGIDGSFEINRERLKNKDKIIGKKATVRYFRLTKDNMLYLPVCKDIDRHDSK